MAKNFIDLIQDRIDDCKYCVRRKVCNNTKDSKPIDDKKCPLKWKKKYGK